MKLDKQTKVADANNWVLEDSAGSTNGESLDDANSGADVSADCVHDGKSVLDGTELAILPGSTERQVLASWEDDSSPPPEREGTGGSRFSNQ